jgi:hypothetical protein
MLSGLRFCSSPSLARASLSIATQRRSITHAFIRPPHLGAIPNQGANGAVISKGMVLNQFRDFYRTLQASTLVDKLHVMNEMSHFDAVKTADQLVSIGATNLAMPMGGIEHRASEFMQTLKFVRSGGGPTSLSSYLQDADDCKCHSGDIVQLPGGMAIANGPRTNLVAHETLKSLYVFKEQFSAFDIFSIEQEADAPPLGDYFGFAGNNTIIAWKDEHGMLAVDQFQKCRPNEQYASYPLQIVYLEPGCHFLSFYGVDATNDVLIQRGFDRSIESLAHAGLNPIPVQWSELDKLGVSMRAAVLLVKFLKHDTSGLLRRNKMRGSRWAAHNSSHVPPS